MIRCPICKGELRVTQTLNGGDQVVRRRKCVVCERSYLTEEVIRGYGETSQSDQIEERRGEERA